MNTNDETDVMSKAVIGSNDVIRPADPEKKPEEADGKLEEKQEEDDGIPYDRGWAWIVTLAVFVNYMLMSGYFKASGLFFVQLMDQFQATATHTALLFSLRYAIFSVSSLYVMNVFMKRYGARKIVLTGGFFLALSAILSSLANEFMLLICLQAGFLALGISMLIHPGQVLMSHYFKKHQFLALCITECGVSVGSIVIPPLVSYLLEQYALRGTLLVFGAVCLHSLPAALLLRPLSFFSKRYHSHVHENDSEIISSVLCKAEDEKKDVIADENQDDGDDDDDDDCRMISEALCQSNDDRHRVVSYNDPKGGFSATVSQNECATATSSPFLVESAGRNRETDKNLATLNLPDARSSEKRPQLFRPRRLLHCLLYCPRTLLLSLDFSLFQSPLFCLFLLYAVFLYFVNIPAEYFPALVSQHDVTEGQAALLLSLIGGLDLVCRVACALIVHSKRVSVITLAVFSYASLGVAMQFVAFMDTFWHFVLLAVFIGLLASVSNCLYPLMIIEFVGIDNMSSCVGWSQLVSCLSLAGVYILLGYIRDVTGSYVLVYHVIGCGFLVEALLLYCEGPVRRMQARRVLRKE